MPTEPLIDIQDLDPGVVLHDREFLRGINPHRFELEQLDHIVRYHEDPLSAVAVRRIRDDEFWVRGHFPNNPLFPGVLMVEAGAQAASFCFHKRFGKLDGKIFGFGGLEGVRFRGAVRPGDEILIVVRAEAVRMRRAVFDMQAWLEGRLVCEAKVIGVTIPI
ncbi:MAG: beta-hydroxyacyl-ACP dehydratase [Planctomycetes bacterium]|nr:beta-hydroxyacyl-ACP dehydratase [Planctomycetota bacterium]